MGYWVREGLLEEGESGGSVAKRMSLTPLSHCHTLMPIT